MGIKNLKHLLLHTCKKGVYHYDNVNSFLKSENVNSHYPFHYTLGIDANLYMTRFKKTFNEIESSTALSAVELGILNQLLMTINAGMIPVYVFDGRAPYEKRDKINQRKRKISVKENILNELLFENGFNEYNSGSEIVSISEVSYSVNWDSENIEATFSDDIDQRVELLRKQIAFPDSDDIKHVKKMLDNLGIPYYVASGEADDLLTVMYKNGIINACLTDDTDMLPKGCGNVIQINKDGVTQFILDDILDFYKFTMDEFIDLCILLGPDYNLSYIPKHSLYSCKDESVFYNKFETDNFVNKSSTRALCILELFNKTRSIIEFIKTHSEKDPRIVEYTDEYINCRKLFNISRETVPLKIKYRLKPISYKFVEQYFNNNSYPDLFSGEYKRRFKSMISRANVQIINKFN